MGPNEKVGQDKYLKLHFYLRPPLGTFAKIQFWFCLVFSC
jgi:hypothetical protein